MCMHSGRPFSFNANFYSFVVSSLHLTSAIPLNRFLVYGNAGVLNENNVENNL
jgi:hypothetical protein